jgi:hypothetical protein
MRRPPIHGRGRPWKCGMKIAECGMGKNKLIIPNSTFRISHSGWPIGPPAEPEAGPSIYERGSPGRCFLNPRPLPPGHNPGIPERSNSLGPPAKPEVYQNEIILDDPHPRGILGIEWRSENLSPDEIREHPFRK